MDIEELLMKAVDNLKRQVSRLKAKNKDYLMEMAKRGKAIERMRFLFNAWKDRLPEDFAAEIDMVIDDYVERCTLL
jgi:hypothetical protein